MRNARWPHAGAVDAETLAQDAYIERICTACQRKKSTSKKKVMRGEEEGRRRGGEEQERGITGHINLFN